MSTIQTILTDVASEAGFAVDATNVVTGNDTTSKQLMAISNRVVREIGERYPWSRLFKTGQITLVASQENYAMPNDFSHYHYSTFWDTSDRWRMAGPVSPQEWAAIKGSGFDSTITRRFMLRGNTKRFWINPTSTAGGEVLQFEYASARYVRPQTWEAGLSVNAGDYIYYEDNYYTASNSGSTGATAPTHTTGSASDDVITWAYYDGKYEKFLTSTDVPVFNDRVFSEGVLERFLLDKKDLKPSGRFDMELEQEFAREIPGRVIDIADQGSTAFVEAYSNNGVFGTGW